MRLYNTMSRHKEELVPIEKGHIGMYCCGPTVYQYAHIGNMRTYIFMDLLRRALFAEGYSLTHVMNITDVGHLVSDADEGEDKLEKSAKSQNKTPWEIAEYYTDVFMKDMAALNIACPEITPKATEHIPEMIEFVQGLIANGYGYETSDGIYFDVQKLPAYGALSRLSLDDQIAGARVEVNPEKRHPADFALWKKAPPEHIMQWESPWGMGFPGWHIECSVMSRKYLGDTFDIHTGGVDHIPVHHENEIAQSVGYLGHQAVKCWAHGEFMLVDGGKMSKSLGNTYRVSDLVERGYSPLHFRYFCENAHYRSKLNFTWEAMDAAKTSYGRLVAAVHAHKGMAGAVDGARLDEYRTQFFEAVADDLNVPKALGVLWNMARSPEKSDRIFELAMEFDKILGLSLDAPPPSGQEEDVDAEVAGLIERRQAARKAKDFAGADRIRNELKEMGILLEDTKDGVKWKRG